MKKYNDILADERPEFKAANYGFDSLSNTELLSMVINRGAGTAESLSQARQLMNMADNNLSFTLLMSLKFWFIKTACACSTFRSAICGSM